MLSIVDRLDIHDLYARYYHEADRGTGEGWALCFTEDGSFERANPREGIGDATGAIRGASSLATINREFVAQFPMYRHWVSNILIDGDGDQARGQCYTMVVEVLDDGVRFIVHGRYDDDLIKTGYGWRFARRVVTLNA